MLRRQRTTKLHLAARMLRLPLIILIYIAISTQTPFLNTVKVITSSVGLSPVQLGFSERDTEEATIGPFPFVLNLSSLAKPRTLQNRRTQRPTRVAYITYTYLGMPEKFKTLIFGALDTYMRNETTFFVVMTEEWKKSFETLCTDPVYTAYCTRLTPIWVDCPESYYAPSPCCKMENGLSQVFDEHQDEYDWFVYMDDDNYIRTTALHYYLSFLDPAEVIFVGTSEPRVLGNQYFQTPLYNCSEDDSQFKYVWGQPAIYSKAAMTRVMNGFRLGAMSSICMLYEVFHDVAAGIFGWMYSLPSLTISLSFCGEEDSGTNDWIHQDKKLCFGCHGIANQRMDVIIDSLQPMQDYYEARENRKEWSVNKPDDCKYLWKLPFWYD